MPRKRTYDEQKMLELEERKKELTAQISDLTEESKKLTKQISDLTTEKDEIQKLVKNYEIDKNTQDLLNSIRDITNDNSMFSWLTKDTRTTRLMTEFDNSYQKYYLLLGGIIITEDEFDRDDTPCLVITKPYEEISYKDTGLTITDLKQNGLSILNWFSSRYELRNLDHDNRFYPLCKELNQTRLKKLDKEGYLIFRKPIRLGCQTEKNRTGYGSEYYNGELISQGTLYGETTSFLIIGAIYW